MQNENIPFDEIVEHDELGVLRVLGTYSYNPGRRHGHPDTWEAPSYEVNASRCETAGQWPAAIELTPELRDELAPLVWDALDQTPDTNDEY